MKYQVQTACEQGTVRSNNEDAIRYGVLPQHGLLWMIVADGMGGHNAGEVASEMLVEHVEQQLGNLDKMPRQGWIEWSEQIMREANKRIYQASQENPEHHGMGTTGVLMILNSHQLNIAWVGDSRAYQLRDNQLLQLTQDHSMIQYLLDKGSITEKEAARSNTKHLLARAIGVKETVEVDCCSQPVVSGDVFMLSTDGIHDHLAEPVVAGYLAKFAADESSICGDIINQAIAQGSKDNLTIGVVKAYV